MYISGCKRRPKNMFGPRSVVYAIYRVKKKTDFKGLEVTSRERAFMDHGYRYLDNVAERKIEKERKKKRRKT